MPGLFHSSVNLTDFTNVEHHFRVIISRSTLLGSHLQFMYRIRQIHAIAHFDLPVVFNFASLCTLFNNLLEQYLTINVMSCINANETALHYSFDACDLFRFNFHSVPSPLSRLAVSKRLEITGTQFRF